MASKNTDEQVSEKKEDNGRLSYVRYTGETLGLMRRTSNMKKEGHLVLVGPNKVALPHFFLDWQDRFHNFETRKSDIFVVSIPKAGSKWVQTMVWTILNGKDARKPMSRYAGLFLFFELDMMPEGEKRMNKIGPAPYIEGEMLDAMHRVPGRRRLKTHLPKELLPLNAWEGQAKMVYICRDPRDVCVSMYHQEIRHQKFTGTFNEYAEIFVSDLTPLAPFWTHVLGFWKMRDEENILFLRYEDMKKDLPQAVRQTAEFFGRTIDEYTVNDMADYLSFDSMKKRDAERGAGAHAAGVKGYMRKGVAGDWVNHFDEETTKMFKLWTERHLKDSDFPFYRDYE